MKKLLPLLIFTLLYFKPCDPDIANAQDRIRCDRFDAGLITRMSANQLPYGQGTGNPCSDASNVLFDEKPGSIVSLGAASAGYSLIYSTTNVREITEYLKSNGIRQLIKHFEGTVQYSSDNGATWANITTGLKWELNRVRFTVYDDKLWITDGITDVGAWNGTTYETYSFIPKGKYIDVDKNKLFIANTWVDLTSVHYNSEGTDPTMEESWDWHNFENTGFKDGDIIMALAVYKNQLLSLKEFSTWGILGYSPEIWRVTKLNSNYGCIDQDSVSIDKNILKFFSREGLKGYNGSQIIDIDFAIEDKVFDSINISGDAQNSFLNINNGADFDAGTYSDIDEGVNELRLQSYSFTWNESTFDGTHSNTQERKGYIGLSTTTQQATARVGITDVSISEPVVQTHLPYGAKVIYAGGWLENAVVSLENYYPPELTSLAGSYYTNWQNISQFADNTRKATRVGDQRWGSMKTHRRNTTLDLANPTFIYEIPIVDQTNGIDLENIVFQADFVLGEIRGDWHNFDRHIAYLDGQGIEQGLNITITDINGNINTYYKFLQRRILSRYRMNPGISRINESLVSTLTRTPELNSGNTVTWDYTSGVNVTHIKVEVIHKYLGNWGLLAWRDLEVILSFPVDVSPVYDLYCTEQTSDEIYNSTGYYLETSTNIGGVSSNVKFGKVIIDTENDYATYGTTATYQVQSSEDNLSWSAFEVIQGSYTNLSVADGQYVRFGSTFTRTTSTSTPKLYSFEVNARKPVGYWTSKKYNLGKVAEYQYYIAEDDTDGATISYFIKIATGSNAIDTMAWSAITSGANIDTLLSPSTNHIWVQTKSSYTITNAATQNPITSAITISYAPNAVPIVSPSISFKDRWHIAIATDSSGNYTMLVYDKNGAWTQFNYGRPILDFTRYGKDCYFSSNDGIYKMYDGEAFNGNAITSSWEKVFLPDGSYDSHLNYIHVWGQEQSDGALYVTYTIENSTQEFTSSNLDVGTDGDIFRKMQPSGFTKSPASYFTVELGSTAPWEVNGLNIHPEVVLEHRH